MGMMMHVKLTSDTTAEKFYEIVLCLERYNMFPYWTEKPAEKVKNPSGEIFISTKTSNQITKKIIDLSKQYPDITFKASISFEIDLNTEIFLVHFRAGEETVVDVKANYLITEIRRDKLEEMDCYNKLLARCIEIFRRVDQVKDDPEAGKYIE